VQRRTFLLAASAATVAPWTASGPASAQQAQITGAGATFPNPVYQKWAEAGRSATGITVNYQSVGSGAGINQIKNRTVDFGATDAPLTPAQLAEANLMQFPAVMGSLVPVVNIPGIENEQLQLTGELLAEIYLGKITRWNDPNLASASPEWKAKVGVGTSVRFPAGTGARGNEGVAGTVKNIRGAIGYVENAYAVTNKLVATQVRNKAGEFVKPTQESFIAAAANADWSAPGMAASLIDQPGAASWPIVSPTFILLPKNPSDAERSRSVMKFFDWAFRNGGKLAQELEYIPLPDAVQETIRTAWKNEVKANGQTVWAG